MSIITKKGQITIPLWVRNEFKINYGDKITFIKENGDIKIKKVDELIDWLCINLKDIKETSKEMKQCFHILKKHENLSLLSTTLKELGIKIVPFDKELAEVLALLAENRWGFKENARDYAISSIPSFKKISFITNNKKHYVWLSEVYTPKEFMKRIGKL